MFISFYHVCYEQDTFAKILAVTLPKEDKYNEKFIQFCSALNGELNLIKLE